MTSATRNANPLPEANEASSQSPSSTTRGEHFPWTNYNSVYVSVNTLPHAKSDENGTCWCNDARKDHHREAPRLDIRSVNYRNRLFKALNQIWENCPMIKCSNKWKDHMLTVTAAVWVTFKKDGIACSENRSVSIVLTQENIASSTRCIYSTISSMLTVTEDDNPTYDFKRVLSLDLIAVGRRMTFDSVPRIIKTMILEDDFSNAILVIEGELAPRSDNSGRKKSETDVDNKERRSSSFFIPRDHEITTGVTTDSHPYLAANFESDRVDVLKKKRSTRTAVNSSSSTVDQIVKDRNPASSFAAKKKIDANQQPGKASCKLASSEKPEPTERKKKPSFPTTVTSGEKNVATSQQPNETTTSTVREKTTFEPDIFEVKERDVERAETRDRHSIANSRPIERSKSSPRHDKNHEHVVSLDSTNSKSESNHAKKRKRTISTSSYNDASNAISKNPTIKDKNCASSSYTARKKTFDDDDRRSKPSKPAAEERKSATTKKNGSLQQPCETFDPPEQQRIGQIVANTNDRSASVRPAYSSKSRDQDGEKNDERCDSTTTKSEDVATKKRKLSNGVPTSDSIKKPAPSSTVVEKTDNVRHLHQRDNGEASSKLADDEKTGRMHAVDERKKKSPSNTPKTEENERASFSKSKGNDVKQPSERAKNVRCEDDTSISTKRSKEKDSEETRAAIASIRPIIVLAGDEIIDLDYDEDVITNDDLPNDRCPRTPTRPTPDASVDRIIANARTSISDTTSSSDDDDDDDDEDEKGAGPLPGIARIVHPKLNVETLCSVETRREKRPSETEDSNVGAMPPPKEIHFELKPVVVAATTNEKKERS